MQTVKIKFHTTMHFFSKLLLTSLFFSVLFGCNKDDITQITAIKIIPSGQEVLLGESITFEVRGNNSTDITGVSEIRVNGEILEGNSFTANQIGTYKVQAFYREFKSDTLQIESVYPSGYIQNLLVEDYTGTWCVNCPKMTYAIEQAKAQSDKIISVGIHAYDPMQMDGYEVLTNTFNITEYPTGKLNRIHTWEDPNHNIQAATELTGYGADVGLAIQSAINSENTVNATIQIGFNKDITNTLKLVIYLTENGLHYDQHNSTEYYGGPGLLIDFEHKDVLRAFYTDYLGETIPAEATTADNIYEYTISKNIPENVADNEQLHLVAFVTDASTNEVINVREVKIGEEQTLQKLD